MRRLSFFLCYQRVPMDNAACADDNDATLHTVLFDFEMSPCQSSKAERGRPKADRAKQSIYRHSCIQINALEMSDSVIKK